MSNLDDYKKDVFEKETPIAEDLIQKYYETNERMKADKKWIEANNGAIKQAMIKLGTDKKDFGQYRVSISVPDTSKFDDEKTLNYLNGLLINKEISKKDFDVLTIKKPNEEAIVKYIEDGKIDLEDYKKHAWITAAGSPRMTITKVKNENSL